MRINRFYYSNVLQEGQTYHLNKDLSRHIYRVLRLQQDGEIQLFNGDGFNYQALILKVGKDVEVQIKDSDKSNSDSPLIIHLGQAISKGDRMDFTVQKAVELGVCSITPIITERVQFRFDESRTKKKMHHWQKIIESACEQSGRTILPELHSPQPLETWVNNSNSPGLILEPKSTDRLMDIEQHQTYRLLIGPEGGLSDVETRQVLQNQHFQGISLGPRILRTETAALTAISILQARFGDL